MANNKVIYSTSKSLVKANPQLEDGITYIDISGLETLIKISARTILFKWKSIETILEIINRKKIHKNSRFI